ncbi:MAG: methyltransferase domain-containing protein [Chloroflexales bacterium]|nr:methyltransferase domain-containing protein [Chloroflexales bacterium]
MRIDEHHRRSAFSILNSQFFISFVRWCFARFYREFAWTYNAVAALVSRGYWRRWTLAGLPFARGRLLELGCGTGNVQLELARRQWPTVGLDASPQMLALTRQRLARAGLASPLVRAVAQAIPLPPASCDTVLATFPSEYIFDPQTLAEIRHVLVPNGRLLIVDAARFTADGPYERLVDLAYRLTLQGSTRSSAPPPEMRLPPLERAGFATRTHWQTVGKSQVMVLEAWVVEPPLAAG